MNGMWSFSNPVTLMTSPVLYWNLLRTKRNEIELAEMHGQLYLRNTCGSITLRQSSIYSIASNAKKNRLSLATDLAAYVVLLTTAQATQTRVPRRSQGLRQAKHPAVSSSYHSMRVR